MYMKRSKKGILILSLYVNDMLLAGNEMSSIVATREWLSSQFEIKDIGEANYMLGVKIVRDRSKKTSLFVSVDLHSKGSGTLSHEQCKTH